MNILVSKIFGIAMTLMHLFVAIFVVFLFTAGAATMGAYAILYAIGVIIVYVFLVGIGSTLVACREHLETLIEDKK
jgi:hypothetical protein